MHSVTEQSAVSGTHDTAPAVSVPADTRGLVSPTDEQQRAVDHDLTRHGRILAGPGTGKSTTAVALIERAFSSEPPLRVKMVTFTRFATAELARKLAGGRVVVLRPSTIHSFAISVLLQNPGVGGIQSPLRIADKWEQKNIIVRDLSERLGIRQKDVEKSIAWMAAGWQALDYDPSAPSDAEKARFMGAFTEHHAMFGYTLLDELPYVLRNALRDQDNLRGVDYDVLVVDEYQDLNKCDLDLISRIAERGCRIIAIGDDDQSIYGLRKASPTGIRQFIEEYAPADDYRLTVSKRCGHDVIAWANHVILGDPARPVGRATVQAEVGAPAGEVALLHFASAAAESRGVARIINGLHRQDHEPLSDILVLLRGDHNRMFSRPIREELRRLGIPCVNPDELDEMLDDPRNRAFLAVLRLMVARDDSLAWATLMRLERGIGTRLYEYVLGKARENRTSFGSALLDAHEQGYPSAPSTLARKVTALANRILAWLSARELPEQQPATGWGNWMAELGDDNVPGPTEGLIALLQKLDVAIEEPLPLDRYIGQIRPLGRDLMAAESQGVRIMTMASSKGLTAAATIIAGTDDGIIPSPHADSSEERRLLYVAMTRARKYLYCTWAQSRIGPTARSGFTRVQSPRTYSVFLQAGPVETTLGNQFIARRWPESGTNQESAPSLATGAP